jgi:hypothetical protein
LSEPAGWDRARPWVLSLVIMALGATGIVVPPQLSARVLPSVSGAAPGSAATDAGSSSEYDMFAQPTIPALPAPLTASAAGWPLPRYCRDALSRHPTDPKLSAMFLLLPQKYYQGTISGAYVVADARLAADADPGTPPQVAHRQECLTRLWSVVTAVYPPYALQIIKGLVVYVPTIDKAHQVEYVGYVSPEDASYVDWTLGLAASSLDDVELGYTLVHELGHLLSLAVSQLDIQKLRYSCPMLPQPEGCLNDRSLLASYVKATWKPQTYRAWLDLWHGDRVEAPAPTDAQRHSWYVAHRNEFVDEYATTNPREDFAESFASWCLDVPVRSAARGKTTFFDDRPELVAMKQRCAALS